MLVGAQLEGKRSQENQKPEYHIRYICSQAYTPQTAPFSHSMVSDFRRRFPAQGASSSPSPAPAGRGKGKQQPSCSMVECSGTEEGTAGQLGLKNVIFSLFPAR